jgi:hypothetical protein
MCSINVVLRWARLWNQGSACHTMSILLCPCGYRLCGLVVRVPGYRSRGSAFDSRRYQIFWEVVPLERGPLSLFSITEELLEWKSSGSGLENWEYGLGDPLRWPRDTLYPQKFALTSPTSGGSLGRYSVCMRACFMEGFLEKSSEVRMSLE